MSEALTLELAEKAGAKPRVVSINPTLHTDLKVLAAKKAISLQELVEGKLSELLTEAAV